MTKTSVATKRRPPAASRLKTVAEPAVKAKTLRLAPEYEAGLTLLKGVLGMPVNKMVNEAVGEYIVRRTAKVESDLSGVLEQVKAYRRADPHFKQAWARFVDAEARLGASDPVEGVVVAKGASKATPRKPKTGSTRAMIRDML